MIRTSSIKRLTLIQDTTMMNENPMQVRYEMLIQRHFELALEKARFEMRNSTAELDTNEAYQKLLTDLRDIEARSNGLLVRFNINDYRAAFKAFLE